MVDIVRSTIRQRGDRRGRRHLLLGDFTIVNSTISGNTSTGWHGGAIFHTEGTAEIANLTITNNTAGRAPSAIFLGSGARYCRCSRSRTRLSRATAGTADASAFAAPNPNILICSAATTDDPGCEATRSPATDPGDGPAAPLADNGGPDMDARPGPTARLSTRRTRSVPGHRS